MRAAPITKLEVILDNGSAFVTYGKNYENEIVSKGVQFPGRGAPDIINRGRDNLQSPRHGSKTVCLSATGTPD